MMVEDHSPYFTGHSRLLSSITIGFTGFLCRAFLYGVSKTETVGLERFLRLLDERRDVGERQRGLITGRVPSILD
jgi:monolysocardiolipin acyltransferase